MFSLLAVLMFVCFLGSFVPLIWYCGYMLGMSPKLLVRWIVSILLLPLVLFLGGLFNALLDIEAGISIIFGAYLLLFSSGVVVGLIRR